MTAKFSYCNYDVINSFNIWKKWICIEKLPYFLSHWITAPYFFLYFLSYLDHNNSKPSVLLFDKNFFIEAFLENKKKKKEKKRKLLKNLHKHTTIYKNIP